ncbi:hypothetical protein BDZ85DRAFT_245849 [Elsinoe ampelina]|uniref:Acyl-CoA dehydrogenase/oxidase n=1 Tax=Elsinoe ampelina TaxID=302913 RepID=A0A6A6GNB2_9PEZI|nr:hypothetical protein BDZ85DRAFT_245849 [Elsinoe ampelina]
MSRHVDAHRRSRAATPPADAHQVDLDSPPIHAGRPSSGSAGFFQEPPRLPNPFEDVTFQRVLSRHDEQSRDLCFKMNSLYARYEIYTVLLLPTSVQSAIAPELVRFGELTLSPEILRLNVDAENNAPSIEPLDSFGRPKNALNTSEGWRHLTAVHHREGLVATGYQDIYGHNDRLRQFLKTFLWSPSSGGVTCPAAMQDGAAALLTRLLSDPAANTVDDKALPVLRSALGRLTSRDPAQAWTSGQWMTERPGGSDVRNTETLASLSRTNTTSRASDGSELGPYSISGFKWFSSATDANMTVLLAKTPGHDSPSLFFAPVHRTTNSQAGTSQSLQHNGIVLSRLKSKLGTRSLPTAELILRDCRGYLLGKEGQGVKEISTVLNITRLHNAVGAVSAWSRALAVARAWSQVRSTGGKKLELWESHVKGLADQTVGYHVATLGVFFGVGLLGRVEHAAIQGRMARRRVEERVERLFPKETKDQERLLRLLTPVLKATTALKGIEGVRSCLESMGGVGYLENTEVEINLAKLLRDTMVLSIWEGTTEVMALDVVRVLKGRDGSEVLSGLERWIKAVSAEWKDDSEALTTRSRRWVMQKATDLRRLAARDGQELAYQARQLLVVIEEILGTILVVEDAQRDGNARSTSIARRWIDTRIPPSTRRSWRKEAEVDSLIVFSKQAAGRSKL